MSIQVVADGIAVCRWQLDDSNFAAKQQSVRRQLAGKNVKFNIFFKIKANVWLKICTKFKIFGFLIAMLTCKHLTKIWFMLEFVNYKHESCAKLRTYVRFSRQGIWITHLGTLTNSLAFSHFFSIKSYQQILEMNQY